MNKYIAAASFRILDVDGNRKIHLLSTKIPFLVQATCATLPELSPPRLSALRWTTCRCVRQGVPGRGSELRQRKIGSDEDGERILLCLQCFLFLVWCFGYSELMIGLLQIVLSVSIQLSLKSFSVHGAQTAAQFGAVFLFDWDFLNPVMRVV